MFLDCAVYAIIASFTLVKTWPLDEGTTCGERRCHEDDASWN